jgi:uncharacterized protein
LTVCIQPTLAQIAIYPIKSLDGALVDRAQISAGGALAFDRRWAIVDERGQIVNAKRTAQIQQIRSRFDFSLPPIDSVPQLLITLQANGGVSQTFNLPTELIDSAKWLSSLLGFPVSLIEDAVGGFPDDLAASGPTIISKATLETICTWFPDLDLAEARRRFRTNLELSGVPAFWEDRLFGASVEVVEFQLGDVRCEGINPCQRCIVPTRNSLTGETRPKFQQIFTQQRKQTLPIEVNRSRFDHFYRLGINTRIPLSEVGKFLDIGDLVVVNGY